FRCPTRWHTGGAYFRLTQEAQKTDQARYSCSGQGGEPNRQRRSLGAALIHPLRKRSIMRALRFDRELKLVDDAPVPRLPGESLVRVSYAGICNTDLEILKGYAAFSGIPGHEFVGVVEESENRPIIGKRVVGEINAGCGRCPDCRSGDPRHCPSRTVLGIKNRDGAFAEFLSLPSENLTEVPDSVSDLEAVSVEPLAAACRILDQVDISSSSRVAVIGDGKLAQLVLLALGQTGCSLTVVGKHDRKLDLASKAGARVV